MSFRERIEQLVQIKKQAGDTTPLEPEEMDGITADDIMKYLELHPGEPPRPLCVVARADT